MILKRFELPSDRHLPLNRHRSILDLLRELFPIPVVVLHLDH
jgi:hypothetical protein